MIAVVVAVIVIISSLVQHGYCFYFFSRLWGKVDVTGMEAAKSGGFPVNPVVPVSVLVCAKNEASNLQKNLPKILSGQYHNGAGRPMFEVIVVNDQSTDDTKFVLNSLQLVHAHLKVVTIGLEATRTLPGKKFALSKGIEAASFDVVLMTDADCAPRKGDWISWMAYPFNYGKEIVAGYGGFYESGTLLNSFIRAETLHTFLQYLTYNLAGLPYMAVGRNLACKKDLLLKAQAQPIWKETASGDDDLLIQLCATRENMVVNVHHSSLTISAAKETWGEWLKQKQRHFSTGKLYSPKLKQLLGGYAMSHALCWLGLLILPFVWDGSMLVQVALSTVLLRTICLWMQLELLRDMMSEQGLKFFLPIFDFAWLLYNFIFAPFIFWKNKQQWK